MPRDVSLSDSKCCENATVGINGLSIILLLFLFEFTIIVVSDIILCAKLTRKTGTCAREVFFYYSFKMLLFYLFKTSLFTCVYRIFYYSNLTIILILPVVSEIILWYRVDSIYRGFHYF